MATPFDPNFTQQENAQLNFIENRAQELALQIVAQRENQRMAAEQTAANGRIFTSFNPAQDIVENQDLSTCSDQCPVTILSGDGPRDVDDRGAVSQCRGTVLLWTDNAGP